MGTPLVGDGRRKGGAVVGSVGERLSAGTAYVFLERPGGAGVPGVTPWSPPGQPLDLESSSGVREKEGTNSRMNS